MLAHMHTRSPPPLKRTMVAQGGGIHLHNLLPIGDQCSSEGTVVGRVAAHAEEVICMENAGSSQASAVSYRIVYRVSLCEHPQGPANAPTRLLHAHVATHLAMHVYACMTPGETN
jgi:hypothetical protein